MKILLSVLAISLLLICGCGDKREDLAEDTLDTMEDFNEVLASIQDEASAKAAKPKFEKITKEMQELKKRGDELKLTQAERDELDTKYEDRRKKLETEMADNMRRILSNPALAAHMADVFNDMEPAGGMN